MMVRRGSRKVRPVTLGVAAVVAMGAAMFTFSGSSGASVSAVTGSAYGYSLSVGLFGGPPTASGPVPTVTLAADGSNSPLAATAPPASAVVGPATFFTSGRLDVSTQGTTGANGSVTTTSNIAAITTDAGGAFGATQRRQIVHDLGDRCRQRHHDDNWRGADHRRRQRLER